MIANTAGRPPVLESGSDSGRRHPLFRIRIIGKEPQFPSLESVSGFLYDTNLLYELSRLAVDPKYDSFEFNRAFVYRGRRPIADDDCLKVEHVRLGSPLDLSTVIQALQVPTTLAAIWVFAQAYEKLANFGLNRKLTKAQLRKAEAEAKKAEHDEQISAIELSKRRGESVHGDEGPSAREQLLTTVSRLDLPNDPSLARKILKDRGAAKYYDRASMRLKESVVSVESISIEYEDGQPGTDMDGEE